jgi:hypothetical protein
MNVNRSIVKVETMNRYTYIGSMDSSVEDILGKRLFSKDGYAISDDIPYANIIEFGKAIRNSDRFSKEHFMNNVEMVDGIELGSNPVFHYDSEKPAWILENGKTFHVFL